jgi:putative hemolysin
MQGSRRLDRGERAASFGVDQIVAQMQKTLSSMSSRRHMTRSGLVRRATVAVALAGLCLAVGCAAADAQVQPAQQIANPASQNCVARGGVLRIESRPDGGQYGVCIFDDNRQCEEWAMFRGECPIGGLRVAGYMTTAARYCAITGGRYTVIAKSGGADEQGACSLPGGKACAADAYYAGTCGR